MALWAAWKSPDVPVGVQLAFQGCPLRNKGGSPRTLRSTRRVDLTSKSHKGTLVGIRLTHTAERHCACQPAMQSRILIEGDLKAE